MTLVGCDLHTRKQQVAALDTKTGELRRYAFNPNRLGSRQSAETTKIHEDHNGILWIGTNLNGLLRFDRDRKNFIQYSTELGGTFPDHIWALLEDSEGNLWFGNVSFF